MADTDALQSYTPTLAALGVLVKVEQMVGSLIPEGFRIRSFNKGLLILVSLVFWLSWLVLPLSELGNHGKSTNAAFTSDLQNYFHNFEGSSECNIRATELYAVPSKDHLGFYSPGTFCHDRKKLLTALSEGGRIGFDAPYRPRGTY